MARVISHRTVVRDGWHNMGCDLCFWKDQFWLVHARISAHAAPDGIVVLHRSADLERWDQVAVFKTPNDARDAKLVATNDELFVYGADSHFEMEGSREREVVYHYAWSSEDGYKWSDSAQVYDRNYWLWRVRAHDGVFYCAEKGGELLSSPDGRNWTFVSRIPDDEGMSRQEFDELRKVEHRMTPNFNEAAVIIRPDGEMWCVSRTKREPGQHSYLYISKPPYEEWSRVDLETMIHCPALCEFGGKVFVAGRRDPTAPWIPQHTPAGNTAIWELDRDGLTPVIALPSEGDAAYPGLVALEEGRLVIGYYSQHAYLSGVVDVERKRRHYMVRWGELNRAAPPPDYPRELAHHKTGPADVFVAEIDLAAEDDDRSF